MTVLLESFVIKIMLLHRSQDALLFKVTPGSSGVSQWISGSSGSMLVIWLQYCGQWECILAARSTVCGHELLVRQVLELHTSFS